MLPKLRVVQFQLSQTIFAFLGSLDFSTKLMSQELKPVANTENGKPHCPQSLIAVGCSLAINRCRSTGQNDALRLHFGERGFRLLIGDDFGIDPLLAHAPRDQLGHLRAEINNKNFIMSGHASGLADRATDRNHDPRRMHWRAHPGVRTQAQSISLMSYNHHFTGHRLHRSKQI